MSIILIRFTSALALINLKDNITALGFSQGASTLTRWLDVTKNRIHRAVVYAGEVAPELLPLRDTPDWKEPKIILCTVPMDKFITPDRLDAFKTDYQPFNFTEISFEGKHEINTASLQSLVNIAIVIIATTEIITHPDDISQQSKLMETLHLPEIVQGSAITILKTLSMLESEIYDWLKKEDINTPKYQLFDLADAIDVSFYPVALKIESAKVIH